MAGIGFKLQRLLVKEEYLSLFQGFLYSLMITSGPWLIMVVSLSVLSIFSSLFLDIDSRLLFNVLLVHIFSITIIITGIFQLFFTRIFADKMFSKEREKISVVIMTNLAVTLFTTCIVITPILFFIEIDFPVKLLAFCFFVTMNISWVLLNYISGSEDFLGFIKHYALGAILGVALGIALGKQFGFSGFFFGFYVGQAYVAILLLVHTVKIYGFPEKIDLSLFRDHPRYYVLILSGFFLYAGMWIDKFILWYGPTGSSMFSVLYYHSTYNDIFYLAFLFTSPIMAIFFITMETSFYMKYYAYNKAINNKATLKELNILKGEIVQSVKQQLLNIVKIQGLIILTGILYSKEALAFLNMPDDLSTLMNIVLLGAFFHMLLLIVCILLLYFDLKMETLKIYGAFFTLNGLLGLLTVFLGEEYYGLGYALSGIIVFIYSLFKLKTGLNNINYLSFTRHPMAEENMNNVYLDESASYGRYYIKEGKHIINLQP